MIMLSRRVKVGLVAVGAVALCAATIPAAIWITHTQSATLQNSRRHCDDSTAKHTDYKVVIEHDKVAPQHTNAKLCDTLTITNLDEDDRLVAFGKHDHHVSYDGISEKTLQKGDSLSVTLITAGNYRFHDHLNDEVQGTFTVSE